MTAGEPEHNPRAVPVLAGAQVLGGIGVASGIAVNGLLAQEISGSIALSGLAQTTGVLGAALLAVPLAGLAGRRGRRPALALGYLIGAVGAALSVLAAVVGSFVLLLLGAGCFGAASASGLQARYAAIDGVPAGRRARALSLVVWAATIGAVAGPNLSGPGAAVAEVLGLPALVGPYVFAVTAFGLAAVGLWALLRPDPLVTAGPRTTAGRSAGAAGSGTRAALTAVVHSPDALVGLVAVGLAHAVMVAVMVMTPVHIRTSMLPTHSHDQGFVLTVVGLVISVHILGMYALSPVWGVVADRFGHRTGIGLGVLLLAVACALAAVAPGTSPVRLGIALALLGLGWSGCVVAGSTLLSDSVPTEVRTAVQGLSDLVMGLVAASAGALAGPVLDLFGYGALSLTAAALLGPVVVLLAHGRAVAEPVR